MITFALKSCKRRPLVKPSIALSGGSVFMLLRNVWTASQAMYSAPTMRRTGWTEGKAERRTAASRAQRHITPKKPTVTPARNGRDRRYPAEIPSDIDEMLFGPGVKVVTTTKLARANHWICISMRCAVLKTRYSALHAGRQVPVRGVPAQLLAELGEVGLSVDEEALNSGDAGELFEVARGHRVAEARVVGPAGVDPRGGGHLQAGTRNPERPRDRQFWQGRIRGHDVHLVHDHAEPCTHVDDRGVERGSFRGVEHQPCGILLASDAQGVHLQACLPVRQRRADLEHVSTEHLLALRIKVVRVIFHERGAALHAGRHDLHRAHEGRGLP